MSFVRERERERDVWVGVGETDRHPEYGIQKIETAIVFSSQPSCDESLKCI